MSIVDNVKCGLKKAFPKPNIPQKRYIVLFGLAVYYGLKLYVEHTDTPVDDQMLEYVKQVLAQCFS